MKKNIADPACHEDLPGKPDLGFPAKPMALQILAGLTPQDWDVKIIDERMEERPDALADEEADLVGITSYSCTAPRAYDIATEFREKGIPVVMGGVHASPGIRGHGCHRRSRTDMAPGADRFQQQ